MTPNTKLIHSFTTFMGPRRAILNIEGGYWGGEWVYYYDRRRLICGSHKKNRFGFLNEYRREDGIAIEHLHLPEMPWGATLNTYYIGGRAFDGDARVKSALRAFNTMYPDESWLRYGVFQKDAWDKVAQQIINRSANPLLPPPRRAADVSY